MIFCKVLVTGKRDDDDITAYEKYEKYSAVPQYSIVVSRDGIARLKFKTAKTTWKKRFKEMCEEV